MARRLRRVAVTGAFGFSGRYIAQRLLARGDEVITLTNHPERDPFGGRIQAVPLRFENEEALRASLMGVKVLFNTYWIRFPWGDQTYEGAVENTRCLLRAAREAGVHRVVHISITHPSPDSPLAYFRGKAFAEQIVRESGLSYAILRPTVLFGLEGILINNMAWLLRRFPLFVIPGHGRYRLQPVYVEDLAELVVEAGDLEEDICIDVAGPEVFTFEELVRLIGEQIRKPRPLLYVPPRLAWGLVWGIGWWVRDVLLTWEELLGLMGEYLVSAEPPRGKVRLGDWLEANRDQVGIYYASEVERHYRRFA